VKIPQNSLHVIIFFVFYDFVNKDKSQSKSKRKVKRFILKGSKSKSKLILKSKS